MKSAIRTALLGGLAMLALSLATAGVAAAATTPEFKPVPTKKKFTSTGGASTWSGGAELINCSKSSMSGEITSATTLGDVTVKYTGCTVKTPGHEECAIKSHGGGNEEILMNALEGELGLIDPKPASGLGVGLLLQPEGKTGWATLEGTCFTTRALSGTLAGLLEVKYGKTGALTYGVTGTGQDIKEMTMDSGTVVKPKWTAFSATWTIEAEDPLKFEEALEVT